MVLVSLALLVADLFVESEQTLSVLWNIEIPIVPVTFLIALGIWRTICPLAIQNMIRGNISRPFFPSGLMPMTHLTGITLLVVLVAAHKSVFNENGPILAIAIMAVAVAALILGLIFQSGFCNSF